MMHRHSISIINVAITVVFSSVSINTIHYYMKGKGAIMYKDLENIDE